MQMTITINMDNAAFEPDKGTEVARILRETADAVDGFTFISRNPYSRELHDINGNTVGKAVVIEGESDLLKAARAVIQDWEYTHRRTTNGVIGNMQLTNLANAVELATTE
jgi:hypothetical protein